MAGVFNTALTALHAAQMGVQTTSHNISNASTPGYTRQQIVQSNNTPVISGSGFIGQGTHVDAIQRITDEYTTRQLLAARTGLAEMNTYSAQIAQVDDLLADPDAGLAPALTAFFKAVQDVTKYPSSSPARQSLLSGAESLTARFQAIDQRLEELRTGINARITDEVTEINALTSQLGEINQQIMTAQAAGYGRPANDLHDQRDELISKLNDEIRTTTLLQADGTYSVFIGNGQPLVVGPNVATLSAVSDAGDPERTTVAYKSSYGATITMPESLLTGGKLGGLLAFRNESLDKAQNALGRVALALGTNFNAQHRLGQDLTGALGGNLFDLSLSVPDVQAHPTNAAPATEPAVTVTNVGKLTTSDYQLSYDGTNYTLLRGSDNTSWSNAALANLSAAVAASEGFTLAAGTWATPTAGDRFAIRPTREAATNIAVAITDTRSVAAAAPIRTITTPGNTGTAAISAGTVDSTYTTHPPTPVTITFPSATTYSLNGGASVAYNSAGTTITSAGWTVQIKGVPATTDSFRVEGNTGGTADNRNALLLGALQTSNKMENGTATYASGYSQIVSDIGNKARTAEVQGKSFQILTDQAQSVHDQTSAVNLDEEAAGLLRYQQAYQAAAKMFEIAGRLLDEILAVGR
ncbi:MAG: flagellar hook-associated protein FlgK [Rhodocyclaceae bacterium]|nr:flagellar hook-associated protein FlgK [Rhodocyclaceae bacterium]